MIVSRLSSNTLTLLLSSTGGALLSFLLSVLVGRILGEDGLGIYAAAMAWVFPLALLAEAGMNTLITREVAQQADAAGDYLHATATLRLLMGGGLMLALVLTAPLLSDQPLVAQGIQISAPLVMIVPFFGAFSAVFRARRIMWPVAALNLGMLALQVGLTAWIFASGQGVIAALVVNTLTSAIQLAAAWAIYRWHFAMPVRAAEALRPIYLLRQAWPFALAGVLAALHLRLGVLVLEQAAGVGATGYYAAANRFVEVFRLLPQAFFDALFPTLAALVSQTDAFRQLFQRVSLGLAGLGLVAGIGGMLAAPELIALTYGPDFVPAVPVLQMGLWALLPGLLKGGRTLYWYAQGQEHFVNRVTMLTLVLRLALCLWLIPLLGAMGAALVNLFIETAAMILLWRRWL